MQPQNYVQHYTYPNGENTSVDAQKSKPKTYYPIKFLKARASRSPFLWNNQCHNKKIVNQFYFTTETGNHPTRPVKVKKTMEYGSITSQVKPQDVMKVTNGSSRKINK